MVGMAAAIPNFSQIMFSRKRISPQKCIKLKYSKNSLANAVNSGATEEKTTYN